MSLIEVTCLVIVARCKEAMRHQRRLGERLRQTGKSCSVSVSRVTCRAWEALRVKFVSGEGVFGIRVLLLLPLLFLRPAPLVFRGWPFTLLHFFMFFSMFPFFSVSLLHFPFFHLIFVAVDFIYATFHFFIFPFLTFFSMFLFRTARPTMKWRS